jgi:hypothetical protein
MSMRLRKLTRPDHRLEQRILLIADLGRRRDCLLESPELDLAALEALLADYEAAGLVCAAADLRRRVVHYRNMRRT